MGRWSAHRDLWKARAWRTSEGLPTDLGAATEIRTRRDGFDDPQPPVGQHTYSVVPLYKDPESGEIHDGQRASVKVTVVAAPPAPRLTMEEREEPASAAVALRWDELPTNATLMLRRTSAEPPGAVGDLLMADDAEEFGTHVARGLKGTAATVSLPAGRWVLVPFAIVSHRAIRGNSVSLDVIPPLTSPEVIRAGPDVLVSWVWPKGMTLARLQWCADGIDLSREVTLTEYQRHGGIVFQSNEAAMVKISGVVRSRMDELISVPIMVNVPPRPPTLTYEVLSVPVFFGLLRSRSRRRVAIVTDLPCTSIRAEIYVHIPDSSTDPDIIVKVLTGLNLGPGQPFEVTVKLPGVDEMHRPYYISCRAEAADGALRVDNFASRGREVR